MRKQKPTPTTARLIAQGREARRVRKLRDKMVASSQEDTEGPVRSLTLPQTRQDLLIELRARPMVYDACRRLNISVHAYHRLRQLEQEFADAIDDARLEGWEKLEGAAFDEALKPSQPGLPTGKLKEFLLKGRMRHVYGDRLSVQQEHRHEVRINLVPVLPAGAAATAGQVVDAELVEDTTPESEES
jgi:hypothetical protein